MAQWSQAAQRIGGVSVKHDAIEDCYVATVPKVPKPRILKRGETDSSSEIDWLYSAASSSFGVVGLLKTGGAGKKRKKDDEEDDAEEGGASASTKKSSEKRPKLCDAASRTEGLNGGLKATRKYATMLGEVQAMRRP